MLVVKSLIFSTLVDAARYSKHIYEAKFATEGDVLVAPFTSWCPDYTGMKGGALKGLCAKDRAVGACLGADAKPDWTQCLEDKDRPCDPKFIKCQFKSDHFKKLTAPFTSWCPAGVGMGPGLSTYKGLCAPDRAVGACLGANANHNTVQCLEGNRRTCDPGWTMCQFTSDHFSLAEVAEVAAPTAPFTSFCPALTGMKGGALKGLCSPTRAVGACLGAIAKPDWVQCLEGNRATCDPGFTMCQFSSDHFSSDHFSSGHFDDDSSGEQLDPLFTQWCPALTGMKGGALKGVCAKDRAVGACLGADAKPDWTQCLEDKNRPCDPKFIKCQFKSDHFNKLTAPFTSWCPAGVGMGPGLSTYKGLCAPDRAVGACLGANANHNTVQCLEGNRRTCDPGWTMCQFKSDHFSLAEVAEVAAPTAPFTSFCPALTGMKGGALKGLCAPDRAVGACLGAIAKPDWVQCLEGNRATCDPGFTMCQFSSDHFNDDSSGEQLVAPFTEWCPSDVSRSGSLLKGRCDAKKAVGACLGADSKPDWAQCLEGNRATCDPGFTMCQFRSDHFSLVEVKEEGTEEGN